MEKSSDFSFTDLEQSCLRLAGIYDNIAQISTFFCCGTPHEGVEGIRYSYEEALSVFGDTERVETYYYQGLDAKHIEIEVIGYLSFNISTDFYANLFKFEEVFQSLLYQGVIECGNGNIYNMNNFTVKVI